VVTGLYPVDADTAVRLAALQFRAKFGPSVEVRACDTSQSCNTWPHTSTHHPSLSML
jgi:hypothetical protein